ncbi:MAG: M23 family metallopeptidase [Gammaproteobacteria bacterium]|nr:M23 family metallopeptidase [Gammaproteobacteria bacterium]
MTQRPTRLCPPVAKKLFCATICVLSLFVSPTLQANKLQLEGNLIQGGLVRGLTDPNASVRFGDRSVRVSTDGVFLIGFGRDAALRTQLVVSYPDGSSDHRIVEIEKRQYNVQKIDGLPPSKVTPSEEDLVRIRTEIELVKKTRQRDDPRTDFLSGFQWPLTGRISGVYGSQRILNGEPRRPHYGVDIAAPTGTVVVAPADGVVSLSHPDMFYSGGTLILDHGHGLSSTFIHLHKALVTEGQKVKQGEPIAEVGATGRATGAHLDWRINLLEQRLDPQILVGPMPSG